MTYPEIIVNKICGVTEPTYSFVMVPPITGLTVLSTS